MTRQTKYRKYDSESDYYAMGYRMYSAEFGRFLAVDPLFEAMPRHNPYHYSYNSPMFWSDPSGLVPKVFDETIQELLQKKWEMESFIELIFSNQRSRADYVSDLAMESKVRSKPRLGAWWSMKIIGFDGFFGFPTEQKIEYKYQVHIPTGNGIVTMDVAINDNKSGFTDFEILDKLVAGINKILEAEPGYFDDFIGTNYKIVLDDAADVKKEYNKNPTKYANGEIPGFFSGKRSEFWFSIEGMSESYLAFVYNDLDGYSHHHQWYSILAHEFGHGRHFLQLGSSDYYSRGWILEHYAEKWANFVRKFHNNPESNNLYFRPCSFYWWYNNFNERGAK